jgi:hypothetical protein
MEILGQLGDKVYVADPDHDVLYATRPPDETVELVGDGRTRPEQFLKFNGAYLTDLGDDRDQDTIIDAVERDADDMPSPLTNTGTPPPESAPAFVAGVLNPDAGPGRIRILTAEPGEPQDATSVWLEGNPDLVTTVADIERSYDAVWLQEPRPL